MKSTEAYPRRFLSDILIPTFILSNNEMKQYNLLFRKIEYVCLRNLLEIL